ncbi:hypothetical protein EDC04DRAFT_19138 [Pisolithus marmoratus]|nr:hypothetical protein EDC04DRAFT_19138 [Pisolithus marmoratus]
MYWAVIGAFNCTRKHPRVLLVLASLLLGTQDVVPTLLVAPPNPGLSITAPISPIHLTSPKGLDLCLQNLPRTILPNQRGRVRCWNCVHHQQHPKLFPVPHYQCDRHLL